MAEPGVVRSAWARGAAWAGSVQLVFFVFGVVQALLLMGADLEQDTRDKAVEHAVQDGLSWGVAWVAVSALLIVLGWVGRRRVPGPDVKPRALHVALCAVLLFVAAQALVYGISGAVARGG